MQNDADRKDVMKNEGNMTRQKFVIAASALSMAFGISCFFGTPLFSQEETKEKVSQASGDSLSTVVAQKKWGLTPDSKRKLEADQKRFDRLEAKKKQKAESAAKKAELDEKKRLESQKKKEEFKRRKEEQKKRAEEARVAREEKRKKSARAPGDPWLDFRTQDYYRQCEISADYRKAMAAYKRGSYDEAATIFNDLMVKDPEHSTRYLDLKRYCERAQKRAAKAKQAKK